MNYPPEIKIRKKIKFQAIFRIVVFLFLIGLSAGFLFFKTSFDFVQTMASETGNFYGKLPANLDVADDWETFRPAKNENQLNILILGIRGENDVTHGGLLTDTILIVSVNKISGKTALISIPRDLFIRMPAMGGAKIYDKINAAYSLGLRRGYGAGLDYAKNVFSLISGLELDYAAVVDFEAFENIIDELGGIDVSLEQEFREGKQWGGEFYLPAGANHLDGKTALYYARSRFSTSDFDRARRQQQIISAIKEKAASLGILGNPLKVIGVLSALNKNIRADIGVWQINELISLYSKVAANAITHKIFDTSPEGLLYSTYVNGAYILLPVGGKFDRIREEIRALTVD